MQILTAIYCVMNKISSVISKVIEAISAVLIAVCALDLFYQVLYRFIIVKFVTIPSPFTEEFARYGLIWITYLAIAVCFREGNMPSLNLLYDRLKPKMKFVLFIVTRICIGCFLLVGLKYGYTTILNNLLYKSPMVGIPGIYLYSAVFVAFVLLSYEFVTELLGVIVGKIEPFSGRNGEVDLDEIENDLLNPPVAKKAFNNEKTQMDSDTADMKKPN